MFTFMPLQFLHLMTFNYVGKALPKEVQMDTVALDEHETLEDRVAKELAMRKMR